MTGSPFNIDNRGDPNKPARNISPQKRSTLSPLMLAGIAVAIVAIIAIAIVVVYQFAQQQDDRARIQQLANQLKKERCASISTSSNDYLSCIQN